MKKTEFLNLSKSDQASFLAAQDPNFQNKAYEDTLFNYSVDVSDEDIAERISNYDDYGTFETLQKILPDFSINRADAIKSGELLTDVEIKALKRHLSNEDPELCIGIHGWWFDFEDGKLFVVFLGSQGAFGISLEYSGAFETKQAAFAWGEAIAI